MKENKKFTIEVKNGLYVGDLCYALDELVYHGIWGKADYEEGAYVDPTTGLEFAMVGTAHGDGCYESNICVDFPVDAGIIGIADLGICTKDYDGLGKVLPSVRGKVTIEYDDGEIKIEADFVDIIIDTDPVVEADDYDFDDEDEGEFGFDLDD